MKPTKQGLANTGKHNRLGIVEFVVEETKE